MEVTQKYLNFSVENFGILVSWSIYLAYIVTWECFQDHAVSCLSCPFSFLGQYWSLSEIIMLQEYLGTGKIARTESRHIDICLEWLYVGISDEKYVGLG